MGILFFLYRVHEDITFDISLQFLESVSIYPHIHPPSGYTYMMLIFGSKARCEKMKCCIYEVETKRKKEKKN